MLGTGEKSQMARWKLCPLIVFLVLVVGHDATGAGRAIGGSLAFDAVPDQRGAQGWQLFVANLDTGRVRRLVKIPGAVSPSWSPEGAEVAFEQARDIGFRCDSPACSQIWRVNATGKHRRRLTSLRRRSEAPGWSNSGRIAYERWLSSPDKERLIETDIYTIQSNGHDLRRLTNTEGEDTDPAWSPDAQRIAFSSDRDGGNFDLYIMNADGSEQHRLTDTPDAYEYRPSWSPDGTRIAFWRTIADLDSIVVINADGTRERTLTVPRENAADPVWSPDGEWIAFIKETDSLDSPEIWVMRADGREKRRLVRGPFGQVIELDWTATAAP